MQRTFFLFILLLISPFSSASDIRVVGMFSDKALVMINGQRHMLSVHDEPVSGVRLLEANSRQVTLDVNGVRKAFHLSRDMGEGIQEPDSKVVRINRNNHGQYITQALINQRPVDVLMDTGANVVALNSREANRLGIDYQSGQRIRVETASDTVVGYRVMLSSVTIGGIRVNHVEASVLEGAYPDVVLMGMSYLRHVKLSEHGGVMKLEAGY